MTHSYSSNIPSGEDLDLKVRKLTSAELGNLGRRDVKDWPEKAKPNTCFVYGAGDAAIPLLIGVWQIAMPGTERVKSIVKYAVTIKDTDSVTGEVEETLVIYELAITWPSDLNIPSTSMVGGFVQFLGIIAQTLDGSNGYPTGRILEKFSFGLLENVLPTS